MRTLVARVICVAFAAALAPLGAAAQPGNAGTRIATAKDGTRLAYDVTGSGPAILLLHGGGQTRRVWHERGYVDRLRGQFTVITMDLRGNGDSDKPTSRDAYTVDRLRGDLLAVADAAGASRFALWGFSYGANIGRYLASASDRVTAMVYIGIPFGAAASGAFGQRILEMGEKWTPIIEAAAENRLDLASLSEADRAAWQRGNVPLTLAWLGAMLEYRPVEPGDMRCPTLWLVGTRNDGALESAHAYDDDLAGTQVSLHLLDGLTHAEELDRIDQVFPLELAFTQKHAGRD